MAKTLGLIVLAAVAVAAVVGGYLYPKQFASLGSAAGATFTSAKVAAININPRSITSTSTSMLNSDGSDRIVTDAFVTCSGLGSMNGSTATGVDAFHWYAATSSTAAPTASVANAVLGAMNMTVATSTTDGYNATTTYTSPFSRRWNSGTYMIFQTNATNTTATCTAGVHYLAT